MKKKGVQESADSMHKMGLRQQQAGNQEKAILCFDKAIKMAPANPEYLYDKAISLQKSLRFHEAASTYDAVLAAEPGNFAAHVNKGLCLSNPSINRQEEALLCFEEALRIMPNDPGAMALKGYALDTLGRFREAIMCFDVVLQHEPGDLNVTVNKGLSLAHLGKYDEAIAYFDRVLQDEPHNSSALQWKNNAVKMRDKDRSA